MRRAVVLAGSVPLTALMQAPPQDALLGVSDRRTLRASTPAALVGLFEALPLPGRWSARSRALLLSALPCAAHICLLLLERLLRPLLREVP
jgi:hypothetical protein